MIRYPIAAMAFLALSACGAGKTVPYYVVAPEVAVEKVTTADVFYVFFPTGGTRIDAEGEQVIARAAAAWRALPQTPPQEINPAVPLPGSPQTDQGLPAGGGIRLVSVTGHTDTTGGNDSNLLLSERRAQAVAERLAAAGIPEDRIRVSALGETQLLIPTADGVAERSNRRVDIDF
jgi:outer membrane protein OmpA-like peptidoglycan-associated protein